MSGGCTICAHERRAQLKIGLVHRVPTRVLAARFNVSQHALHRHRHNHLTPQMAAAILAAQKPSEVDLEQLQASESEGLLAQLVAQRARLQSFSEEYELAFVDDDAAAFPMEIISAAFTSEVRPLWM